MIYVMIFISVVVLSSFLTLYYRLKPNQVLLYKMATSTCFMIVATLAVVLNQPIVNEWILIVIGLGFGWFGDYFLGKKEIKSKQKKMYFFLGITMFFIGHIFYIFALIPTLGFNAYYYVISSVGLFIALILGSIINRFIFGHTRIANYLYMIVCAVFISFAVLNTIYHPSTFLILIAIGSVLFVASDFVLCFLYFKKITHRKHQIFKRINLSLYYSAQLLIALSLYFLG